MKVVAADQQARGDGAGAGGRAPGILYVGVAHAAGAVDVVGAAHAAPRSSTLPARPTRSAALIASAARDSSNTASTGSFSVPSMTSRASSPIMRASSAGGVAASRLLAQ